MADAVFPAFTSRPCKWNLFVTYRSWIECLGAKRRTWAKATLVSAFVAMGAVGPIAAEPKQPASNDDGKYADADGNPTYNFGANGKADWYTFSGYRRYHSECHVCHGPDGAGSTYAPALAESLKTMDYATFLQTVAQGRKNVGGGNEKVMPSFGLNKNVMCYVDDIYVYLKARADGALGRVRPEDHEPKPTSAKAAEDACMGNS